MRSLDGGDSRGEREENARCVEPERVDGYGLREECKGVYEEKLRVKSEAK